MRFHSAIFCDTISCDQNFEHVQNSATRLKAIDCGVSKIAAHRMIASQTSSQCSLRGDSLRCDAILQEIAQCKKGIIDSDYVEPVFAMVTNISGTTQYVKHNERICQGELSKDESCILEEISEKPERKTNRDGGFGSTGKE